MLRDAFLRGRQDALAKHGMAQPSLAAVGIKAPTIPKPAGLPGAGAPPPLKLPAAPSIKAPSSPSLSSPPSNPAAGGTGASKGGEP